MANFLDRETALAQTRNIRGLGAPILLALTDWGAEIFERCSGTVRCPQLRYHFLC